MSFKEMEYKSVQLQIKLLETKSVDGETVYCGYAATYDIDSYDDRIIPGAFEDTIQKRFYEAIDKWGAPDIKVYRGHVKGAIVGVITLIEERKSGPQRGLYVEWKFIDSTLGRDTKAEVDAGAVNKLSIGYFVLRREYTTENGVRIRDLHKLDLPEFSIVDEPVNENAAIGRKGQETEPETKEKETDMDQKAKDNMRQWLVEMQRLTTQALSSMGGGQPDKPDGPDHPGKPSPFGATKGSDDCTPDETKATDEAKGDDGMCKACGQKKPMKKSEDTKMCSDNDEDESKATETPEAKEEEKEEKGLKNTLAPATKQINDQLSEMIKSIDTASSR